MGTTDRPDLQLSLKKGDSVIVLGNEDVEGYFTAIVNGKSSFSLLFVYILKCN